MPHLTGHFPQNSPIINGFLAENDLQLKAPMSFATLYNDLGVTDYFLKLFFRYHFGFAHTLSLPETCAHTRMRVSQMSFV